MKITLYVGIIILKLKQIFHTQYHNKGQKVLCATRFDKSKFIEANNLRA